MSSLSSSDAANVIIILAIIVLIAALIVVGPIITIWALNLLFGLHIPVTFSTWFATLWISATVGGVKYVNKKE